MRLIPTKVHGVLDYLMGILLLASPWLFSFADSQAGSWIVMAMGAALIGLSLFTNYETGLIRRIPMSTHLTIDVLAGVLLAASPWLLGFADFVYVPHVVLGILEIGAGLLTQRTPAYYKAPDLNRQV